jgi:hypothetical protein
MDAETGEKRRNKMFYETSSYNREIIEMMDGCIGHPLAIRGAKLAKSADALDALWKDATNGLSPVDRENIISAVKRMDDEIDSAIAELISDGHFEIETDNDGRWPRVIRRNETTGEIRTLRIL